MISVLVPGGVGQNELQFVRLTVEQFHGLIGTGIFEEGAAIELLDGLMVWKDRSDRGEDSRMQGTRHTRAIRRLLRLFQPAESVGYSLQSQLPVTLGVDQSPEPDVAILIGPIERFDSHHPTPHEIRLLVEVSDSSLNTDRTTKLAIYAEAGVPEYWIVNLVDSQIHVYWQPIRSGGTYANERTYSLTDAIAFALDPTRTIDVPVGEVIQA